MNKTDKAAVMRATRKTTPKALCSSSFRTYRSRTVISRNGVVSDC